MKRSLQLIGSPLLRKKALPVDLSLESDLIDGLLEDMWRILREKGGLGLAAPQAGESLRLFILDSGDISLRGHTVFVNPVLELEGPAEKYEEGCLSIPGIYEQVSRSSLVTLRAQGRDGREFELKLEDLVARVVQHECDHLEGILLVDRLTPVRRRILRSKLARIREEETAGIAGN